MEGEEEEVENETVGDDTLRRVSETAPTKIKPIPKDSAFFLLSHTNW